MVFFKTPTNLWTEKTGHWFLWMYEGEGKFFEQWMTEQSLTHIFWPPHYSISTGTLPFPLTSYLTFFFYFCRGILKQISLYNIIWQLVQRKKDNLSVWHFWPLILLSCYLAGSYFIRLHSRETEEKDHYSTISVKKAINLWLSSIVLSCQF